ncbi:MAG: SpoIIE family protein phosphatase [Acidobacteriaceae bacterium]|nr:SpoIIE family protein phosphatase [Acidobacteriaceae bacterium]
MWSLFSYSWRAWRHAPAVAILAASALALGVTATTAIYTFIQTVLLKPLPYADPDRYMTVLAQYRGLVVLESSWSYPNCIDFERSNRTMAALGCLSFQAENLVFGKQTRYEQGNGVNPSLMQALGVPLQAGSWFSNAPADLRTVVISDHLWREFGGPRDIVGKQITLNSVPYAVKGVAKPWFHFPPNHSAELWFPLDPGAFDRTHRDSHWLNCLAKMKPGVTETQARADMVRIASELEREYPKEEENHTADVVPLLRAATDRVRPVFFLLLGAAIILLLIACGNVASLLLARSVARTQETAVRVAIGASIAQLTMQYIAEGLFVALLGASAGLLGSVALVKLVLHYASAEIPRAEEVGININVLAVTLGCAVLCGVLFSLAPLWQAVRISPNAVLTNGIRSTASAGARRVLGLFITAQIALSCALLIVAILCVQRLGLLWGLDAGFDQRDVTIFFTYIPSSRFGNDSARADYQTRLLRALEAAHLARTVGFTSLLPFSRDTYDTNIVPEHQDVSHIPFKEQVRLFDHQFRIVSPSFFAALRIPLIAGRYLTDADGDRKAPALVIDQTVASRLWPHTSPLGQRVLFGGDPDKTPVKIVGVVNDVQDMPGKPAVGPLAGHAYVPYQIAWSSLLPAEWALRTTPGAQVPLTAVENAIHTVDPQLAVYDFDTMEKRRQAFLGSNKLQSDMTLLFGLTALVLAVLGVYGVVTYTVRQRIPEMGTRLALGATSNGLLYLVLKQALVKAALGGLVGVAIVFACAPLLHHLDISVNTPSPFVWSLLAVIFSTVLAATIPAWRASLLSPAIALRNTPESIRWRVRTGYARAAHSLSAAFGVDRTNTAEAALLAEIAESTRQADSFTTAIRTALTIMTERIPAQAAILLVRRAEGEPFRCLSAVPETNENWSLPVDSLLLNRLAHYYPALPFMQEDLDALERWSQESNRQHAEEISTLRSIGPAVVAPVAVKSGISGLLFVRLDNGKSPDGQTMRLLRSVASQLALMVENSHLTDRIVEQERLRRELALASEVQKRLFPEKAPDVRSAQLVGYCLPARGVGGDYYDFLRVGSDQLGIALADVAGKGIAAALVMSVVQASLRSLADDPAIPISQVTGKINRLLCASTGPNSYATFFYARLDEITRCLRYVNGGHNPPFLLRNHGSGAIEELKTGGMIVGMFPFSQYEEGAVQLEPGDVLMLFTDGVSEAHNPQEEEFGEERLKEVLRRYGHLSVNEMSTAILGDLRYWMADAPQHDDLTFVLMKVQ